MAKKKADASLDEEKIEEIDSEPSLDEEEAESPVSETIPALAPTPDTILAQRAPVGSKAKAMREKLAQEPKVRVFIPLAPGEKQGVTQSVILNGYPIYIRKGSYVDVPQSVAEVLEVKLKHKMQVEDHPERISGDRPVKLTVYGN
jgi:hypothetical protein